MDLLFISVILSKQCYGRILIPMPMGYLFPYQYAFKANHTRKYSCECLYIKSHSTGWFFRHLFRFPSVHRYRLLRAILTIRHSASISLNRNLVTNNSQLKLLSCLCYGLPVYMCFYSFLSPLLNGRRSIWNGSMELCSGQMRWLCQAAEFPHKFWSLRSGICSDDSTTTHVYDVSPKQARVTWDKRLLVFCFLF